jgi:hypothetical protein
MRTPRTDDQKAARKVVRWRRRLTRIATLVAMAMFFLIPAGAAQASFFCDSEKVPAPQMPGSASSFVDPGPLHTSPAWSTDGTGGFVYERYGYPPSLSTFDTGCANLDPSAGMDVMIGNWTTGIATMFVALSNATHRFASGAGWLGNFDALVQTVTDKVSASTYMPFVGLALITLGIFLIWEARKKRLAPVVQHVAWALLVMTFAATVMSYPLLASQTVDEVTATTIGSINSGMVGEDPNAIDPAAARESLVTDKILYQNFLRANFGDNTSLAAKDGPKLLDSLTYSRDEQSQIHANPSAAGKINDGKKVEFQEVADDAEKAGGDAAKHGQAYLLLQGKGGNHMATGALALVAALCILPFLLMADLLVVVSLLVVRLAVMAFPAIAVVGVTPWGRPMVKRVGSLVGGAMFNAIVFSLAAALDVLVVSAILSPDSLLAPWVGLLLSAVLGVVLWKMLKPHRQMAATFGKTARKQSKGLVKKGIELYAGSKVFGTVAGKAEAHAEQQAEEKADEAAPRPESFTRPPREPSPTLSDRPARISPKDDAMAYRFPHKPTEKPAPPAVAADGSYSYSATDYGNAEGRVPNSLVSREPGRGAEPHEPVEIYTPPAREPFVFAHEEPSYAAVAQPLITRPEVSATKPHQETS